MRPLLVIVHRWIGLVMALFLLIAGVTGSMLAFNDELEAAISPQLFRVEPVARQSLLSPLELRERVRARFPQAVLDYVPLTMEPGRAASFYIETESADDQVFINPYTGAVLGARKWGDITQGTKNLMPFIYRLHYSLALGTVGSYAFGIVALLWTADCFVGAYLTLPARRRGEAVRRRQPGKSWPRRWGPAWKLRWTGGSYKLNFDLHRAGGLWVWAMLFVLAWSSVGFNLSQVYNPVMRSLFAHQQRTEGLPALARAEPEPAMGWLAALQRGRELMNAEAQRRGFKIESEDSLSYDPDTARMRYDVRSSLDIRSQGGSTEVLFDARSGERKILWLPSGGASGDTANNWLTSLHMAAVWGLPLKIFVCLMGVIVAMLSVTGAIVWWRKRQARAAIAARSVAPSSELSSVPFLPATKPT